MKKLLTILFAVALGLNLSAQTDYVDDWNPDADGDDLIGITDLLALLSLFAEADSDGDGIWDSVDDCIGVYDPCGVCNGTGEDADEDGLCDDADDCVGEYDECGVCNGPGPYIPVIDEILYTTDSLFIEPLDEWYVFEYATDTLFTFVCPVSGCMDEAADNYNPEAVIEDDSCVYGPSECGGASTVTFDGYTYDLVAIGDQCWFAENLRNEHYANGEDIPGDLSASEWWYAADDSNFGAQAIYNNDPSNLVDYGRLYNWYAVNDARGLCPNEWRVPTDSEYTALIESLGGPAVAGEKMKSSPFDSPSWDGTNISGFSGLAGGVLSNIGNFSNEGSKGFFWSSSSQGPSAWFRELNNGSIEVDRSLNHKGFGFSVRCIRD